MSSKWGYQRAIMLPAKWQISAILLTMHWCKFLFEHLKAIITVFLSLITVTCIIFEFSPKKIKEFMAIRSGLSFVFRSFECVCEHDEIISSTKYNCIIPWKAWIYKSILRWYRSWWNKWTSTWWSWSLDMVCTEGTIFDWVYQALGPIWVVQFAAECLWWSILYAAYMFPNYMITASHGYPDAHKQLCFRNAINKSIEVDRTRRISLGQIHPARINTRILTNMITQVVIVALLYSPSKYFHRS